MDGVAGADVRHMLQSLHQRASDSPSANGNAPHLCPPRLQRILRGLERVPKERGDGEEDVVEGGDGEIERGGAAPPGETRRADAAVHLGLVADGDDEGPAAAVLAGHDEPRDNDRDFGYPEQRGRRGHPPTKLSSHVSMPTCPEHSVFDVLGCLFARSVEYETVCGERRGGLDVEGIEPMSALAEQE